MFYDYPAIWRYGKGTGFRVTPMFKSWLCPIFIKKKKILLSLHKVAVRMTYLTFNRWSIFVPLPVYKIMTRGGREIIWEITAAI